MVAEGHNRAVSQGNKKPGDETVRVPPGLTAKKPATTPQAPGAKPKAPGSPTDSYVTKSAKNLFVADVPTGSHHIHGSGSSNEMAPEVSQGRWRDRVVAPRKVMTKDEMRSGLESTLRVVLTDVNHVRVAFEELRRAWLPTLRQVIEQTGGDGLDAWLLAALRPPASPAMDPIMSTLIAGFSRLRATKELAAFEEEALKLVASVSQVLSFEAPRKLSFKVLEKELEGKLEVDELFLMAVSDDAELTRRLKEIGGTMENLREQIRKTPGKQPTGIFSNFVRLKAEVRVLDAELQRRASLPKP